MPILLSDAFFDYNYTGCLSPAASEPRREAPLPRPGDRGGAGGVSIPAIVH